MEIKVNTYTPSDGTKFIPEGTGSMGPHVFEFIRSLPEGDLCIRMKGKVLCVRIKEITAPIAAHLLNDFLIGIHKDW